MSDLEPYTSGYMKPPKHSRFKPGKSGNPKGRPKQPPTAYTALQKALKRKVAVNGGDRKIRLDEALIRRLRELALSGDRRAIVMQQSILEMNGVSMLADKDDTDILVAKERFMEMQRENPEATIQKDGIDD